ncbi:MAG TPA: Gfo/Idh/MocA family oxidoreductase [Bryobacteraceae bacterium]|nr:Gfo/Idh/MocA family oxidoreductase [Bryobacteraceae bacterium]HPT25015.1 Gfo/Idh/MocA family oxidoreductase [Bryobacteraceae bacterium]
MDFTNLRTRRSVLTGAPAMATAFTIVKPELVRGSAPAKLKAGLIGCGGRGTQAVIDAFNGDPAIELHAMGDAFEDKLETSIKNLRDRAAKINAADRVKVDPDKRFVGFDAFKKVVATDVDVIFLAAPPGWRPLHFEAAIEAGKHVFCEKPFGVDATGVRRCMAAARKSVEKKLTVVSGAQRRSDDFYIKTVADLKGGKYGDVLALYAYWIGGPVIQQPKGRQAKWGEFEWQHRNWYSNLWICGDQIVEQHLHNIDVCNWIMGTHPVKVVASGGAAWRPQDDVHGNIYDHLSADFEYPNGVRMSSHCRQYQKGCYQQVNEIVACSKGRLTLDQAKGAPGYVAEHAKLYKSIRGDGPYVNEAMEVAESTLTCIMGREAAYSGLQLTWDQIMNSKQDLMPKTWDYNATNPPTPFPVPGKYEFI